MPKTTPELAHDVEALQQRQGEQDVRNMKVDTLLEVVVKQAEKFETALVQFQQVVEDTKLAITQLQEKTSFQGKVFYWVGSILLVLLGVVAGQFFRIHP